MDYENTSKIEYLKIRKYRALMSSNIDFSSSSLGSNLSMYSEDNDSVFYQMGGLNTSTFENVVDKFLLDRNLTLRQNISFNEGSNSTLACGDNDLGWDVVFEFVFHGVLLNCVGILGLVGNLLSIFILSRPQMKGSTNCILIGLATYDGILIISRYHRMWFIVFH